MKTLFIALSLLLATSVFSQNITNTLGLGGVFKIKDASNDFLKVTQSTGEVNILKSLRLENTTNSTTGVIYKGLNRFIHNYGFQNTFYGENSGNFTMTGYQNTALGFECLFSNTTGYYNLGLGFGTLASNTTGYSNAGLGFLSLYSNTTGYNNTALGYYSLFNNTTGINNTAIGNNSGSTITTGSNNTNLGNGAEPLTSTSSNQITLGNNQVNALRCNVQTFFSLSDKRDKKNITDLSLGLDFIMKLKPRQFNWDKREWYEGNKSDGSKISEVPTAGFISQELDAAQTTDKADWLNLVLKENPDRWEASYGNLLPVMVKAIQELEVKSEKLQVESAQLKNENKELKENNEKLISEVESLKIMNEKIVKLEKMMNEMNSVKHTSNVKKEEVNLTSNK